VNCSGCNISYSASAKFCPECGAPKPAGGAGGGGAGGPCSACGANVPANAKFCPECGTKPAGAAAPAAAAAPRKVAGLPDEPPSNCKGCGKAFMGMFITALGGKYHPDCFKCGTCNTVISEARFAVKDGSPLCNACVSKEQQALGGAPSGSLNCERCGKAIEGKYIKPDGHVLHAECFTCSDCGKGLMSGYVQSGNKQICGSCASKQAGGGAHHVSSGASAAGGYAEARAAPAEREPAPAPKAAQAGGGGGAGKITCTRCFTAIPANSQLCPECGKKPTEIRANAAPAAAAPAAVAAAPVAAAPAAAAKPAGKKFCGECGAQGSGMFCGECGGAMS